MSRDAAHPGPTCWVTRPLLRIDYALLSPGLCAPPASPLPASPASATTESSAPAEGKMAAGAGAAARAWVRGYQRMDDDASDHFAVVVDLALGGAVGAARGAAGAEAGAEAEAGENN